MYVHFRAQDLFDTETMDRSQLAYMRIRLCMRGILKNYISKLEHLFEEHIILQRAEILASRLLSTKDHVSLQLCMIVLDKLDKERVEYIIAAENFVGRDPPQGIHEWSPTLEKVGGCVTYLKLRLDYFREGGAAPPRLQRIHNELQIEV